MTTRMNKTIDTGHEESWDEVSDEKLIEEFQRDGSVKAFTEVVRRYSRPLHAHLNQYLRDETAAADVLQDTWLKLFTRVPTFDTGRCLRPWLYAVATHQAIDYLRRNRRHRTISLSASPGCYENLRNRLPNGRALSPATISEDEERSHWVRAEVDKLSEPLRDVVSRVYYKGLTLRETAAQLGLPVGTVKSRTHAARGRLIQAWRTRRLAA